MTGGASIGAATAVDMSGKKGSEKVISFMREEMASTAEKRGRNKKIARGMVDEELTFTNIGWIYHFNSIPDELRLNMMNKTKLKFLNY